MPNPISATRQTRASLTSPAHSLLSLIAVIFTGACGAQSETANETRDDGGSPGQTGVALVEAGSTPVIMTPANSGPGGSGDMPGDTDEPIIGAVLDGGSTSTMSLTDSPEASFVCGSTACSCSDGMDNDGDGVADGMDQECTGPQDNDEGTFATGIPGDNQDPKWQDCFFDGNSGAGDDGCRYHTDCLTGDAPSDSDSCTVAQACIDFCQPLTPPGCDCFGCCDVPFEGATIGVRLSDTCSLANLNDEDACPRCVPTTNCSNECGECELCLGKTLSDLPASCGSVEPPTTTDGGVPGQPEDDAGEVPGVDGGPGTSDTPETDTPVQPPNTCDVGDPCQSTSDCAAGDYCRLGCCVDYTPQVL